MSAETTIPTPYGPLPRVTVDQLDTFTRAYLECALWSSHDNADESGGEPFDRNYDLSDLAPEALAMAADHCAQFQRDNTDDLAAVSEVSDTARNGHDFWLTRNRHGAGFWDRVSSGHDLAPAFKRLTDTAHAWGSCDPYLGDDGAIYLT